MTWLHRIWMSPAKHERIVEELQLRIDRLEKDYLAVARSLIGEMQASLDAEPAREVNLAAVLTPGPPPRGNVIPFKRRGSEKPSVLVAALEENQIQ